MFRILHALVLTICTASSVTEGVKCEAGLKLDNKTCTSCFRVNAEHNSYSADGDNVCTLCDSTARCLCDTTSVLLYEPKEEFNNRTRKMCMKEGSLNCSDDCYDHLNIDLTGSDLKDHPSAVVFKKCNCSRAENMTLCEENKNFYYSCIANGCDHHLSAYCFDDKQQGECSRECYDKLLKVANFSTLLECHCFAPGSAKNNCTATKELYRKCYERYHPKNTTNLSYMYLLIPLLILPYSLILTAAIYRNRKVRKNGDVNKMLSLQLKNGLTLLQKNDPNRKEVLYRVTYSHFGKFMPCHVLVNRVKVEVVIKVFSDERADSFNNERNILRRLHDPKKNHNIIDVYGISSSITVDASKLRVPQQGCNVSCLVFPFYNLGSLESVMLKKIDYRNNLGNFVTLAVDIANSLSYLYIKNVVHNDIKPHNIFVHCGYTNRPRHVLGDFGSAVIYDSTKVFTRKEFTEPYLPPEWEHNRKDTVAEPMKLDVYQYALVLWESQQETKDYRREQLESIKINTKFRPSFDGCTLPGDWQEVVKHCWSHDPSDRPTAQELYNKVVELSGTTFPVNLVSFRNPSYAL